MVRVTGWSVALLLLLSTTGCGGEVKIASAAVRQGAGVFGRSAGELEIASGELTSLARQANVEQDVIREVAPQLDNEPEQARL